MAVKKGEKFSYTKLNTYENCPFHFYLKYRMNKYPFADSCASLYGSLVHYILEQEANCIKNKIEIDYNALIESFCHSKKNISQKNKENVLAIDEIEKRFADEWKRTDSKSGKSYAEKSRDFIQYGIYRFPKYMEAHPELEIIGAEVPFNYEFSYIADSDITNEDCPNMNSRDSIIFHGYIDLLMYDKKENTYIIWDIKTKDSEFKDTDLTTPLQFVCYCGALRKKYGNDIKIKCFYSLPVIDKLQDAGTKGFEKRGEKKIVKILSKIKCSQFNPSPSPLCYWCEFSNTNPNITEDGKNQCPYYSLWTKDNKTFSVRMEFDNDTLDDYYKKVKKLQDLEKLESMSDEDFFDIEI